VRGIRLGEGDLIEHAYLLDASCGYSISYKDKPLPLEKLKLAKRDTKGTKK